MVEAFFDELPDGVCMTDAQGVILYMNPAAERLMDVPFARTAGKTLCGLLCGHLAVGGGTECASTCELLKPGSRADAVTFRGSYGPKEVATWRDFKVQRRSVWKDFRVRCLKSSGSLIGEGKHLAIIQDVSADVELEKQKEDWRQMIAHDLRSPLTNIYAAIRIVQDAEGRLPEGGEKIVDAAERSCRKMLELINLYLDVAKLDSGVAVVQHVPIRLRETVRGEAAALAAAAKSKGLEVLVSMPEEIVVEGDPDLLSRVVQNVLDNAVKFTPPGGRVSVNGRAETGQAVLSIKDSGPGIAPEELPLLFDRYHQARARRAGKIQGTGLGLTFCREALKIMRGGIAAASGGDGTEFIVRLPLAEPGKLPAAPEAS